MIYTHNSLVSAGIPSGIWWRRFLEHLTTSFEQLHSVGQKFDPEQPATFSASNKEKEKSMNNNNRKIIKSNHNHIK